ncbi:class IV adenylate cyclase [Natrialba asiatica]|uniref:Adenylyl cyclase CyaB n=1 Tax=Natrialba asiatica (strain ATCC 700177 / DSM 12278 / JCM 9576 / FERM P-10747 / NBRC 102637 / 172P1) TaxID=29540 RepID=M0ATV3_NATA1|nr:class IV adenylate cyclase [Natrialba asiatica]ELZ00804.1 adenylyl cyclase CyaB [Natrialba asiatica DSM 12278]
MYEVEVKVPATLEVVRARLEDAPLEVTPQGAVVQTDTYYDAPHRSFPETDEALRIRSEHHQSSPAEPSETAESDAGPHDTAHETRVTYKGPLVDEESKTREEIETTVGDAETFDAVLTNLGFEAAATVRKERERYAVVPADGAADEFEFTVTLDAVDDVGEYVEVETELEDERALESARNGAYNVLRALELDPDDQIRTSYLGLLLES